MQNFKYFVNFDNLKEVAKMHPINVHENVTLLK